MLNKKFLKSFLCILRLCILSSNAQAIMLFVKNALLICYNSVIPSLYIFMVFSNYVAQSDLMAVFSIPLKWYSNLMKIQDKQYSSYLFLSLIGGFAVGANFLKKLEKSRYPTNALKTLAISMINNSFSFCVFAVGIGYLGNYNLGLMLFAALTCASLISAFLMSFIYKYNIVPPCSDIEKREANFVSSINSAVQSILTICGFVIIFYCACEVFSLYMIENDFLTAIFSIFMEVTSGCVKTIEIYGKNSYFLCFCLSILPVSTLCQVYYFTDNKEIIKSLLISRLIHTPVSMLVFALLANLFPVAANVANNNSIVVKGYQNSMEISATLFLITVVFFLVSDNNKLFTKTK